MRKSHNKDTEDQGPLVKSATFENGKIIRDFTHVGGG